MSSTATGRSLSPIGTGIAGLPPVPAWIFQPKLGASATWIFQPKLGASATTQRDQDGPSPWRHAMRRYNGPRRFYVCVGLHARSMLTHILDHDASGP